MAPRADLLRTEIDKARGDLARDLRELKVEVRETKQKAASTAAKVAGAVVAAYVVYRVLKFIVRRVRA